MSSTNDSYEHSGGGTSAQEGLEGTVVAAKAAPPEEHVDLRSTSAVLRVALLVAVVFGLILVAGYIPRFRRNQTIAQEQRQNNQAPVVIVTPAARSSVEAELTLPGSSTALIEAPVYARASGYIRKRFVDLGDHVKAGQLLAIIDAPDLDQQVDQVRANMQQSESVLRQTQAQAKLSSVTWERYKVMVERGVFSKQEGDTQEANYNISLANVRAAQDTVNANKANLQRLLNLQSYERVSAPFAGVVTARNIDVGSLISTAGGGLGATNTGNAALPNTGSGTQGGEMFRVAQVERLRVFVSVPEARAQFIAIGQKVKLRFDSARGQSFEGTVVRTANAIDPNTRTLLTEIEVENKSRALLPGTYVTATFNNMRTLPSLVVPGDALISRSSGTMVATVRNNVVHFQPVVLGRDYGQKVEIREGLQEGDLVILNPGDSAKDGAKVNARLLSQPSPTPGQPQNGANTGNQNGGRGAPAN
jgi:multidrug efflux pump subunit AcrA (membrane-fusion protein)